MENHVICPDENKVNTQKNFCCHIKACKKDRTSTAPLKENGLLVSDSKGKANILNRQYQLVFSTEDPNNIPVPDFPNEPPMPNISISEAGVFKLLSDLKENKAPGQSSRKASFLMPHHTLQSVTQNRNRPQRLEDSQYNPSIQER